MEHLRIGYARCSSVPEDLDSEREALAAAGVAADRIYLDVELSGINRARPALGEAMAACWAGSMLVVTGLDRLVRPVPDASDIVTNLADRHVTLVIGESVYDPSEPLGAQLGAVLAVVADFEGRWSAGRRSRGCG
ncbi:MAG: recombinase family protein [Mycobacteriaceae bacterium]